MRALVVAPQPFFTPRGTPFSVYYRTLILSELGVKADLLTYGQGQDVDLPNVRLLRIPGFRSLGSVKVGPSGFKLFLDQFLILWTVALLSRNAYDFVHAHEESVFFCQFLKPIFGFKLVYDMHSSLPQQLSNFRYTSNRMIIRLFDKLERRSLSKADAVITISPTLADYALGILGDSERHFLIENSLFDEVKLKDVTQDSQEVAQWEEQIPKTRRVVAYAGTFESYQGLDVLIRAFAYVLEPMPEVFLLMVGGSPQQVAQYQELARECGLEGACLFTGGVSQGAAKRMLLRADVLTSPRTMGTNTPLKIYEMLASGKPIVATRVPSHTQVLSEATCFMADPDPVSFGRVLLRALSDTMRATEVTRAARLLFEQNYSRTAYKEKMKRLLSSLE